MSDLYVEPQETASENPGDLPPAMRALLRAVLGRVLKAAARLEVSYSHALTRAAGVWLHDVARQGNGTGWEALEAARVVLFWRDTANRTGQTLDIIRTNPTLRFAAFSLGRSAWRVRAVGRAPQGWRDLELSSAWTLYRDPSQTEAHKVAAALLAEGAGTDRAPGRERVSAHTVQDALRALRPLARLMAADAGARGSAGPPNVPAAEALSLLARAAGASAASADRAGRLGARLEPLWRDVVALDRHLALLGRPVADIAEDDDARSLAGDLDALIAGVGTQTVGETASTDRVELADERSLAADFDAQLAGLLDLNATIADSLRQANTALGATARAVLWPLAPTVAPGVRPDSSEALLAVPVGLRVTWREIGGDDAAWRTSRPDLSDLRAVDAVLAARLWDARAAALTAGGAFTLMGPLNVLPVDVEVVVWSVAHRFDLLFVAVGAGFQRDLGYGLKGLAGIVAATFTDANGIAASRWLTDAGSHLVASALPVLEEAEALWGDAAVSTMSQVGTGAALAALAVFVPSGTGVSLAVEALIIYGRSASAADAVPEIGAAVLTAGLGKLVPVIRGLSLNTSLRREAVEAALTSLKSALPRSDVAIAAGMQADARLRAVVKETASRYSNVFIDVPAEAAIGVGVRRAIDALSGKSDGDGNQAQHDGSPRH